MKINTQQMLGKYIASYRIANVVTVGQLTFFGDET